MDTTALIMTAVLIITLAAPVLAIYSVKFAVKKDFQTHKKWQTFTYMITVVAVIALELLIRFSGGSGSISGLSPYADEKFFGVILIAHIIGAVLTYILWTYLLLQSRRKFDTDLPGNFSKTHKILAKVVIVGLIYTAVSALIVYLLTLGLI